MIHAEILWQKTPTAPSWLQAGINRANFQRGILNSFPDISHSRLVILTLLNLFKCQSWEIAFCQTKCVSNFLFLFAMCEDLQDKCVLNAHGSNYAADSKCRKNTARMPQNCSRRYFYDIQSDKSCTYCKVFALCLQFSCIFTVFFLHVWSTQV